MTSTIADAPPHVCELADELIETIYEHFGGADNLRGDAQTRAAVLTALAAVAAMTIEAGPSLEGFAFFERALNEHIRRYSAESAALPPITTTVQ